MGTLELLLELHKHDNNLKNINLKLKEISDGEKVKTISAKLEKMENRLKDIEKRLETNQLGLNRNDLLLRDLYYRLKETEKDLYGGKISDLKQLSYLDKERETIQKEIDKKELEIIQQMEKIDNLKEEFSKLKEDFKELKLEYINLIEGYNQTIEDLKLKAYEEISEKEKISPKIEQDILNAYVNLKKTRGYALAEIIDNRCSGCNMLLPTIVIDRLKNMGEIVYCENCGRILYINKQDF
ncbi:MAG: hypothetical protein GX023_09990 [Tissierellia bacterium]|nr:hypothetical protein [Tissierellia bacterium]